MKLEKSQHETFFVKFAVLNSGWSAKKYFWIVELVLTKVLSSYVIYNISPLLLGKVVGNRYAVAVVAEQKD